MLVVCIHQQCQFLWLTSTGSSMIFPDISCTGNIAILGKTAQFHLTLGLWVQTFLFTTENGCQDRSFKWLYMTLYLLAASSKILPLLANFFLMYDFCSLHYNPNPLSAILPKTPPPKVYQVLGLHWFHKECFNLLGCTVPLKHNKPQQLMGQKNPGTLQEVSNMCC